MLILALQIIYRDLIAESTYRIVCVKISFNTFSVVYFFFFFCSLSVPFNILFGFNLVRMAILVRKNKVIRRSERFYACLHN